MPATLPRRLPVAFRSLHHRDFRILWTGLIVSAVGTWMQIIAQSLLVLKLTHGSAFALGIVSFAQALAFFLFALIGGGFADRFDRKRLLFCTQATLMSLALALGFLSSMGSVRLWMIVVIAFLSGTVLSFDQPARAVLVASLVPKEDLLNAISLQSAVFNGASTLGPALAGITIVSLGLPADFFLNATSFLAVLVALLFIRPPKLTAAKARPKLIRQVAEALTTVKRDSMLPRVLISYATLLFFGPSLPLLLPVLALRILHVGPETLGFLFTAAGAGAVLGALLLASLPNMTRASVIVFGAFLIWSASLVTVGLSGVTSITFLALITFGMSQSVIGAITSTLLQTRVPHEQRGRVMSLNTLLIMGIRPLGDFPAGALISLFGAPLTAAATAGVVGATAVVLLFRNSMSELAGS